MRDNICTLFENVFRRVLSPRTYDTELMLMVQRWDPDYGLNLIRLEGDRVSRCGAQLTHSAGRWVGARVDDSAWEEFGVGENNRTGRYSGSIFSRARIGRLHYNYYAPPE